MQISCQIDRKQAGHELEEIHGFVLHRSCSQYSSLYNCLLLFAQLLRQFFPITRKTPKSKESPLFKPATCLKFY